MSRASDCKSAASSCFLERIPSDDKHVVSTEKQQPPIVEENSDTPSGEMHTVSTEKQQPPIVEKNSDTPSGEMHVVSTENMQPPIVEENDDPLGGGEVAQCSTKSPSLSTSKSQRHLRTKEKQNVERLSKTRTDVSLMDEKMELALKNRHLSIEQKVARAATVIANRQQKTKEIFERRRSCSLEKEINLSKLLMMRMEQALSSFKRQLADKSEAISAKQQSSTIVLPFKDFGDLNPTQTLFVNRDVNDFGSLLVDIEGWSDLTLKTSSTYDGFLDNNRHDVSSVDLNSSGGHVETNSEVIRVIMVGTGSHDRFFPSSLRDASATLDFVEKTSDLKEQKDSASRHNDCINSFLSCFKRQSQQKSRRSIADSHHSFLQQLSSAKADSHFSHSSNS